MATQVKLAAKKRNEAGRNAVKALKARASVPAVIYGPHRTPENIEVSERDIKALFAHATGESILVDLNIDGAENSLALIQEVQHHPVRGNILHVDFLAVSSTEEISAEVTLQPTGDAVGVKNSGGLLQQSMHKLLVTCLPQNLPEIVLVDVSSINVGGALHVRDLVLPEGVKTNVDGELTVFLVSESKTSDSAESAASSAGPEVIKEKKPAEAAKK